MKNGLTRKTLSLIELSVPIGVLRKANRYIKKVCSLIELDYKELLMLLGIGEQKYEPELKVAALQWKAFTPDDKKEIVSWLGMTPQERRKQVKSDKGIKSEEQIDKYMIALNSLSKAFDKFDFKELEEVAQELSDLEKKYNLVDILSKVYNLIDSQYNDDTDSEGEVWQELINILHLASYEEKEVLENTDFRLLAELFIRIYLKPKKDMEDVFFIEQGAEALMKYTNSLSLTEKGL